ncbi:MAG: hypothetical protein ABIS14_13845 [Sphingomonas sp.]
MSDIAMRAAERGEGSFRPRTVALIVAIGLIGFVGMLILGAYAPDLRSGKDGGAHALSNAAVGLSGIVRLAEATGRNPRIIRNSRQLDGANLTILTPPSGVTPIGDEVAMRGNKPTLVVLPKWQVRGDPSHSGWVRYVGLTPGFDGENVLAPAHKLHVAQRRSGGRRLHILDGVRGIAVDAPRPLQTVTGTKLRPVIDDGRGGVVLGQLGDGPLYVLADSDLLSNQGIADPRQAEAVLAVLDRLNDAPGANGIDFDVTLDGLGHSASPLKLAFDPPFLAMTLTIAAALLLVGWQAVAQFGAPRRRPRAIAFGKTALIDNAAALVSKAGRERALGGRYAYVMRERAATAFGAPARLRDAALDSYLDRLPGRPRFTDLANGAAAARERREVLVAAQALHDWQGEKAR